MDLRQDGAFDAVNAAAPPSAPGAFAQAGGSPAPASTAGPTPAEQKPAPPAAATDAARPQTRLLVYTANLNVSTFETTQAIDKVEALAREVGGYLVSRADLEITIRVPADRFQTSLERVLTVGDVLRRDVKVEDVTQQYFDLEIRLRNAEAVLGRLNELLARAQKVEDALAVERELQRVAQEVEQLKGRLKLLRELLAYSTITVRFEARPAENITSRVELPFPWLNGLGLGHLLSL
jgi:hypothetical protein